MMRIDMLLRQATACTAPGEPELLLAHVLDKPRSWLYAHGDEALPPQLLAVFEALLARRVAGEPVAYLTGTRGFWRFDLRVDPGTLIPRPETELLVELALQRLPEDRPVDVVDLGTGSGAIALALAFERPAARVLATDASSDALDVARANATALGLANIGFRHGDWFAPLAGDAFDLIASNPPYIAETDPHLVEGDLRFEPRGALASGIDGLDAIRVIARDAPRHLRHGGWLLIEHGWEQGEQVRALLAAAGLSRIDTARDLAGHGRITSAERP